ncbi:MAG: penicillin acylase family protein [Sneathiella sp.]|nr:penicillin acylase family protein [Sneathiella sp.]
MSLFKFKRTLLACTTSLVLLGSGSSAFATVTIERDQHGVPRIEADTNGAMWAAFGYVQARDRIVQMDILRQTALGILPDIAEGEFNNKPDIEQAARKLRNTKVHHKYSNLAKALEKEIFSAKDPQGTIALYCFAKGISAFRKSIALKDSNDENEFCGTSLKELHTAEPDKPGDNEVTRLQKFNDELKLGFRGPDWSPIDVAALFHLQVMDEFSNRNTEMNNLQNLIKLTEAHQDDKKATEVFNTIKWALTSEAATTIPSSPLLKDKAAIKAKKYHKNLINNVNSAEGKFNGCKVYDPKNFSTKIKDQLQYAMHEKSEQFPLNASNWWVISQSSKAEQDPQNIATGVMYNGPQITALDPAKTYQVSLKSKEGFQVSGNSYLGTINFWQGFNGDLAFGLTAGNIDVSDIFCVQTRQDEKGIYYTNNSGGKRYLQQTNAALKLYRTADTNWPVVATDDNGKTGAAYEGTAYIQRYNWENSTVSSLFNWMKAVNAPDIHSWNHYLDKVGGNFNLIALDKTGQASYRLTGSLPLKAGMKIDRRLDPVNWNYYPSYDPRLPAPIAPEDGWIKTGKYYHKLRFDMRDDIIANWNQKPFVNMPDGDLDYDSYFRFDRVSLIVNMLKARKKSNPEKAWTLKDVEDLNGELQRLDVNYNAFWPFLEILSGDVQDNQGLEWALNLIQQWSGIRGAFNEPDAGDKGAHYGHVLFYNWIENLTAQYNIIISNNNSELKKHLSATLLKAKQPYLPNKMIDGAPKQRVTFMTSHGIQMNNRIILNDLHAVFEVESNKIFNGTPSVKTYHHKYDSFQFALTTKEVAINLMKTALIQAIEQTEIEIQNYKGRQASIMSDDVYFPTGYITYNGVSDRIGSPMDVRIGFREKPAAIPHFRNRGALNIIAGFIDGKVQGKNVNQPGVREYRGHERDQKYTNDQVELFKKNEYRKMHSLDPHILRSKL